MKITQIIPIAIAFATVLGCSNLKQNDFHFAAYEGDAEELEELIQECNEDELEDDIYGCENFDDPATREYACKKMVYRQQTAYCRDAESKDVQGNTPAHFALSQGHHNVLMVLIRHGAYIFHGNGKGINPAMIAAFRGDKKALRLIANNPRKFVGDVIDNKADFTLRDNQGKSLMDWANMGPNSEEMSALVLELMTYPE